MLRRLNGRRSLPLGSPRQFSVEYLRICRSGLNCGRRELMLVSALQTSMRKFSATPLRAAEGPKKNQLAGYHEVQDYKEDQQKQEEDPFSGNNNQQGYLPFPAPFHTFNIVMLLFLANCLIYGTMNFCNRDDWKDFFVEHFTLSHDNYHRIYPIFTSSFYQEQFLQLAIDCWLLWQFGNTMLGFLGNGRMAFFWAMCCVGGGLIHIARQKFELHYGIDPLEVRGRCFGPNPFILGLVGVEGLIFRHLNFIQQPPVPFLVLTAFVMVIDVWRIFTTKPEEHSASTGGALVAYFFWLLPTRFMGLDKLTATF